MHIETGGEENKRTHPVAPEDPVLDAELAQLETLIYGLEPATLAAVTDMVQRARALGAPVPLGRALCLQARVLAAQGNYAAAIPLADESIAAFAELDPAPAETFCGFVAEAWRVAGLTRMGLARNAEALRLIEQAILIAEAGAARLPQPDFGATPISASTALIRARSTLGGILLTARNLKGALDALDGAVAAIDAAPQQAALIPDEIRIVFGNITKTLHRLVREHRAADEPEIAARYLENARIILDSRLKPLVAPAIPEAGTDGRVLARSLGIYWEQMGESFLLGEQPAEALACFLKSRETLLAAGRDGVDLGNAACGMARACLALGQNEQALSHARTAIAEIGNEDVYYRSIALLVLSQACRAVGDFRQALECLEMFNTLRDRLEAAAAQQYAAHITARIGLERVQAEAESERKTASTLAVLGQVGQQITASLEAGKIFDTLYGHVGSLLDATTFVIWLLDANTDRLRMAFGREDGEELAGPDLHLDDPRSRAALAVRERREVLAENRDDEMDPLPIPGTRKMQTMLFAPLIAGECCVGVLSVQSDRPHAYDENARWILRTLCAYGAIALDNAAAHRQLSEALVQLHDSQAQLARRTEELERLSTIDPLTGAGNRRFLEINALAEIAESRRHSRPLGVTLFDLDHFKTINDRFGHVAGDEVLKRIVEVTRRMLRPGDLLARLGGEEFALLLPGSDAPETAAIAERIRSAIAATSFHADSTRFTVTASFGTSGLRPGDETLSAVLNRADKAMYRAKRTGRNRVVSGER